MSVTMNSMNSKKAFVPFLLALAMWAAPEMTSQSFAQVPTFNPLVASAANTGSLFPDHATVGDFNGDGKLDAIITDGDMMVRVMLGNGAGSLTERDLGLVQVTLANVSNLPSNLVPHLSSQFARFAALQAADVNADGRLDLVCVETVPINFVNYSFIGVLLNIGNDSSGLPQFAARHHWVQFLGVRPVTLGDLNGDSSPDVIIGTSGGLHQVWLNDGSGGLTPGQLTGLVPGAGGPSTGRGVITDLDGDGDADFVTVANQNGAANVFFGNGNGTFQTPPLVLPNIAVSIAVADVNGDSRPDLLMGNLQGGSTGLLVYLNQGGGAFSSPTLFGITGFHGFFNGNGSVAVDDVNGDGELDAVLSAYDGIVGLHNVAVMVGDGSGGFSGPILFPATFVPTHLFLGDFTSDGKVDIGVVVRNSRSFGVLMNTTVFAPSDTTPPVITAPENIVVEASGPSGTIVAFSATASDTVSGAVAVTATPPSGSNFPIGTTTVTLSASDAANNSATASFTVTVRDSIAPLVNLPADQVIEATGPDGAVAWFTATASDVVGVASLTSSAASGSTFPIGVTTVTITATDATGNSTSAAFTITVRDTVAPVVNVPADQVIEATGPAGAVALFAATAVDTVGVASFTSSAASGSIFPVGTTTVTVTATDAAGNSTSAAFTITVRDTVAPVLTSLAPSSASLWPPNHKMIPITLNATAMDATGVVSLKIIGVTSSEPDNGLGDGDTAGDVEIVGDLTVNLRAERSGKGNGRTYIITVEARDSSGNSSTATCSVAVQKSQGK